MRMAAEYHLKDERTCWLFSHFPARMLAKLLNDEFDEKLYKEVKEASEVQKLTWKVDLTDDDFTFWSYLKNVNKDIMGIL